MEAVELPPVGMSWARAGLPALGPPPLKKGRSRQELMQREAEFQRRRGAAPAARGRRQALDPLAGSRRRPDAQERPPAMGLDGFERPEETGPGGVEPPAEPQRLAALPALPALAGAQRSTKRRRAAKLRRPLPAASPPPRGTLRASESAFDLARGALPAVDPLDAPRAERKPVTDMDDPRIEAALRRLEGAPEPARPDAEERPPAMGLDGFEPPAPDERLRFSEADRPDAFRRPDAEERPPAMGLEGFEPPAKDSWVGPDTLERSATLAELMMSTPGKRPAAPPRGTRSLRRLQHANSLRREKSKKLTGELAKAIFSPEKPQKPMREDLQLVWQDVFDYEGAPHPARWQFQCEANDWVHDAQHGERQWYTDSVRNCHVRNGKLRIIARRERSNSCKYTSARLRTKYRGDWLYGRVEVRARLPPSKRGLWPAIWLLPTDEVYGGWPHSGEIDVMEHVGWEKNGLIHSACHSTRHNPTVGRQRSKAKLIPTAHRKFHVYAVDWQPTRISIFVDNELVLKVDDKGFGAQSWPYDQRFHLLLNLAVGGWGGMKGIDDRAFPACFEVDSVRVFQKRGR